ncbi:MAG: hypothetical protein WBA46_05775 [Thermomicrobiales bacterium]
MDRLAHFVSDLGHAYTRNIVDHGKQPAFVMFLAFLLTFATVRFITTSIRDGRHTRLFHNMSTSGGTHLHHLVPGIILVLIAGWVAIGFPHFVHPELLALLFGAGAALTLDEFALWFHLADVYWSRQGRQSVDAVVIAATLIGIGLVGGGIWADIGRAFQRLVTGT